MTDSKQISRELHAEAKKQGITHQDIADKLGKHRSQISRALSGKHSTRIEMLVSISYVLGYKIML
jgi:transcriptional regulator with XRE-family HTH domain